MYINVLLYPNQYHRSQLDIKKKYIIFCMRNDNKHKTVVLRKLYNLKYLYLFEFILHKLILQNKYNSLLFISLNLFKKNLNVLWHFFVHNDSTNWQTINTHDFSN